MSKSKVIDVQPLGFPWQTSDPFLFCVHHDDAYPAGNEQMGPERSSLKGRNIGMDFEGIDGWRMYHGDVVPGFPRHPHRGFETITVARRGYIDHSDSLGATGQFGNGDVQWMTAGKGVVHCEMFPLVNKDKPNPTELFQIWLNLPRASKMVDPYYSMLWGEDITKKEVLDAAKRKTVVTLIAGSLPGVKAPPPPPPDSWASKPDSAVAVYTLLMDANGTWALPAIGKGISRTVYFFRGTDVHIDGQKFPKGHAIRVEPDAALTITNGDSEGEILVLEGRPIGEPVVQHGPFVMNTRQEIMQAFMDYQETNFGGWPWKRDDPVHPRGKGRFAKHADGKVEDKD